MTQPHDPRPTEDTTVDVVFAYLHSVHEVSAATLEVWVQHFPDYEDALTDATIFTIIDGPQRTPSQRPLALGPVRYMIVAPHAGRGASREADAPDRLREAHSGEPQMWPVPSEWANAAHAVADPTNTDPGTWAEAVAEVPARFATLSMNQEWVMAFTAWFIDRNISFSSTPASALDVIIGVEEKIRHRRLHLYVLKNGGTPIKQTSIRPGLGKPRYFTPRIQLLFVDVVRTPIATRPASKGDTPRIQRLFVDVVRNDQTLTDEQRGLLLALVAAHELQNALPRARFGGKAGHLG